MFLFPQFVKTYFKNNDMKKDEMYLVYENWQATKKAVVHKGSRGHANEGHQRHQRVWLRENHAPNDRWYGYFTNLNEAIAFASLLPDRQLKLCKTCLNAEYMEI